MTYLTDSTFVIDHFTGPSFAVALLPTLLRDGLALSIVTHMELWEGSTVTETRTPLSGACATSFVR